MSAYNGAEVCELYKIYQKYNKGTIGLYCDDGLAIFKNISGPKLKNVQKGYSKLV